MLAQKLAQKITVKLGDEPEFLVCKAICSTTKLPEGSSYH